MNTIHYYINNFSSLALTQRVFQMLLEMMKYVIEIFFFFSDFLLESSKGNCGQSDSAGFLKSVICKLKNIKNEQKRKLKKEKKYYCVIVGYG